MSTGARAEMVNLTCEHCSTGFSIRASDHRSRVKAGNTPRFCGRSCYGAALKIRMTPAVAPTFECEHCKTVTAYPRRKDRKGYVYKQRFCGRECFSLSAKNNAGLPLRRRERNGYIEVFTGGRGGKYVPEHRQVMEEMIGRPLHKDETVHHRDGVRDNNDPSNLELWSSRHGKGQRVSDKVAWAVDLLKEYPGELEALGYELRRSDYEVVIHPAEEYMSALARLN